MVLEGPSWLCCTQNSAASSGPLPARSAGKPERASPSPWKGLKGEALVPTPQSAARLLPSLRAPRRPVVTTSSTQTQVGLIRNWAQGGQGRPRGTGCHLVCLYLCTELPATSPDPILRADLAGILGASGVLLFGCIYLLHLLHRQRHWSVTKLQSSLSSTQTQTGAREASQVSLASFHTPYATVTTNYCPAALDTVLPHQPLSRRVPLPIHTARQPAPRAPLPASTRSSFISVENGLYTQAEERPPHTGPNLISFPDRLGPRAM